MNSQKRILVAPLNWGLGHATRCIPIIQALLEHGFRPIIASDGKPLELLRKEFKELAFLELPSYKITYARKGAYFKLKLVFDAQKWIGAIYKERSFVEQLVRDDRIDGIISDNRLGVYSPKVPAVFVTHQLNVLSGNTTALSTWLHQKTIQKFDACWVPDMAGTPNLSGKLGHLESPKFKIDYLGPLSRFNKMCLPKIYDLMVLISGPEPQRTLLEEKLLKELQGFHGPIVFVRGVVEDQIEKTEQGHITMFNYLTTNDLELALNQSAMVLSRSGYTTVMDLAKLEKKAFFIPTPGQYEQVYLAESLDQQNLVPTCKQDDFTLEQLGRVPHYKGLSSFRTAADFTELFHVFQGV